MQQMITFEVDILFRASVPHAEIDTTGDGVPNFKGNFVDTNGDGVFDAVAVDTSGDGVPNIAAPMVDSNGDGNLDSVVVDSTGDGVADTTIKINIAYGSINGAPMQLEVTSLAATHLQVVVPAGKDLKLDELMDAVTTYAETQLTIHVNGAGATYVNETDFDATSAKIGGTTIAKPRGNEYATEDPPMGDAQLPQSQPSPCNLKSSNNDRRHAARDARTTKRNIMLRYCVNLSLCKHFKKVT